MRNFSLYIYGAVFGGFLHWAASNTGAQIPEGWEIVEIFPAGTEYDCGRPDINDKGQIVFHQQHGLEWNEIEIFGYDRGRLLQLTNNAVYDAFPKLNNHGQVVWQHDLDPDPDTRRVVIFRTGLGQATFPSADSSDFDADINDAGQIVWSRGPNQPPDTTDIWLLDADGASQITDTSFAEQSPRINQHGDIVLTRYDFSVSPWTADIVAYFSGTLMPLTQGNAAQYPDLNDHRIVVWHDFVGGWYRLIRWEEGEAVAIVPQNAAGGHVNNRGEICFGRWDSINREHGLWLLRKGVLSQVTDGSYGGNFSAQNERGEIAFQFGRVPSYGIALLRRPSFIADIDFDGDVDLHDFAVLQRDFGSAYRPQPGFSERPSDMDNDLFVDPADAALLIRYLEGPG